MDLWEVVSRTKYKNFLWTMWAFNLKRFPYGLIKKFKAQFCARGDPQVEGIDFFETYAPVAQWTTICLMLKSNHEDIAAAFLHANLEEEEYVFVEIPLGFRKKGIGLRLKKTLDGLHCILEVSCQNTGSLWNVLI